MNLRRVIAAKGAGEDEGAVIGTPKNELIDDAGIITPEAAIGSPAVS
jgi:hypothetical protein